MSHAVFGLYGSGTSRRHCPIVLWLNLKIIAKYVRGTSLYIVQYLFDIKIARLVLVLTENEGKSVQNSQQF